MCDAIALHGAGQILGPQGSLMNDGGPAQQRDNEAAHEVNGVIGGKNRKVSVPFHHGKEGRQDFCLCEVVVVGQHASFGCSSGTRRIDHCRHVLSGAFHQLDRLGLLFPRNGPLEIGLWGSLGDKHTDVFQEWGWLALSRCQIPYSVTRALGRPCSINAHCSAGVSL